LPKDIHMLKRFLTHNNTSKSFVDETDRNTGV
jgi:hypothetical protein